MELRNKKVLVTGADGFIGSHLVQGLINEGCSVRAFVFYNSFNSWGWLDSIPKESLQNIEIFSGDIRDPNGVRTSMEGVDIVFHLAALIAIPYSYHSPDSYIDTNIKGTLNVLQSAKYLEVDKILITSTSEVYGTAKWVPIKEDHPKQGQSPYSATKIAADALSESFFKSFGLPITIVRPFNTYGPRQSARAVIPTIITQLLHSKNEIILGDLSPTRDLLYVEDTVQGFIEIAKSDSLNGHECNIATNTEVTIEKLATKLIDKINPAASISSHSKRLRPKKSEVFRLLGSNEKLMENTNWSQQYSLDAGLKKTIEWFSLKSNLERYKSDIYNI